MFIARTILPLCIKLTNCVFKGIPMILCLLLFLFKSKCLIRLRSHCHIQWYIEIHARKIFLNIICTILYIIRICIYIYIHTRIAHAGTPMFFQRPAEKLSYIVLFSPSRRNLWRWHLFENGEKLVAEQLLMILATSPSPVPLPRSDCRRLAFPQTPCLPPNCTL